MSDRTEKPLARSERPVVTPQPTRQDLFEWVEDKFKGRADMPRSFELHLSHGPGGIHFRPETIHEKEFRPNEKKPEREAMVEISNKFLAVAQAHCNELGRPQGYVIHALNHIKSAHPYGVYYMKLRPLSVGGVLAGEASDETEVLADSIHRDRLLHHYLEHMKASDENARFMQDCLQRSTGTVIQVLLDQNRELRSENNTQRALQLDYFKAMQEAYSTAEERKQKADGHRLKMELLERGAGVVFQLLPVVAKSLEGKKNGALPAHGDTISASAESVAIEQFVRSLKPEQTLALFGSIGADGVHLPGVFTTPQVQIFDAVASLKIAPQALEAMLPSGQFSITAEQVTEALKVVPMDQLMPIYAIVQEGHNQRATEAQGAPQHEAERQATQVHP